MRTERRGWEGHVGRKKSKHSGTERKKKSPRSETSEPTANDQIIRGGRPGPFYYSQEVEKVVEVEGGVERRTGDWFCDYVVGSSPKKGMKG